MRTHYTHMLCKYNIWNCFELSLANCFTSTIKHEINVRTLPILQHEFCSTAIVIPSFVSGFLYTELRNSLLEPRRCPFISRNYNFGCFEINFYIQTNAIIIHFTVQLNTSLAANRRLCMCHQPKRNPETSRQIYRKTIAACNCY